MSAATKRAPPGRAAGSRRATATTSCAAPSSARACEHARADVARWRRRRRSSPDAPRRRGHPRRPPGGSARPPARGRGSRASPPRPSGRGARAPAATPPAAAAAGRAARGGAARRRPRGRGLERLHRRRLAAHRRVDEQDDPARAQVLRARRRRSGRAAAAVIATLPRPRQAAVGDAAVRAGHVGRVGGDEVEALARPPARTGCHGARRIRTPLSAAVSRAASTARRETSTAIDRPQPARLRRSRGRRCRCRGRARARPGAAARERSDVDEHPAVARRLEHSWEWKESHRIAGDPHAAAAANAARRAADELRRALRHGAAGSRVGVEEEVMMLDPETLELAPRAPALLERLGGDGPLQAGAARLAARDHSLRSATCAAELAAPLLARRDRGRAAAAGLARLAAGGGAPVLGAGAGELNAFERYRHTRAEYGRSRSRQLVCALHVHVAVGDAGASLAVYNAARSYLPLHRGAGRQRRHLRRARQRAGLGAAEAVRAAAAPGRSAGARRAGRSWPPPIAGAPGPARSSRRGRGGGSCGCTPPTARWSSGSRTRRARSPTPSRSPASSRRSSVWLAERHEAGERTPGGADAGGSRRTAGRPAGMVWAARMVDLRTGRPEATAGALRRCSTHARARGRRARRRRRAAARRGACSTAAEARRPSAQRFADGGPAWRRAAGWRSASWTRESG